MTGRWHEERQFGQTVGTILIALGGWYMYRGRFPTAAPVMISIGATLALLALAWPRVLAWPNRAWMALAEALAFVSSRIILAAVFLVVVVPIGAIMRRTRWDPLHRRAGRQATYWIGYSKRQHDPRHYEKMF